MEDLREKGLTLHRKKCFYSKDSLEFFDDIFSREGVSPDANKVKPSLTFSRRPIQLKYEAYLVCGTTIPDLSKDMQPLHNHLVSWLKKIHPGSGPPNMTMPLRS